MHVKDILEQPRTTVGVRGDMFCNGAHCWLGAALGRWTRFSCVVPAAGRYVMLYAHPMTPYDRMTICEVRIHAYLPEPGEY